MPRGDKTGPEGLGPETGRAAGYCSGCTMPGFMNPGGGGFDGVRKGISGRAGRGRGNRNWYYATGLPGWKRYNMGLPARGEDPEYRYPGIPYAPEVEPEQETQILKDQTDFLKQQLGDIQKRTEEIKKGQKKSKRKEGD